MTTKTAKSIRTALKTLGYGPRDVSVRNRSYSMGSTVDVRIINWGVPFQTVSEIAARHEVVHRDESGEILSGGNSFVDVDYAAGALDALIPMIRNMIAEGRTVFGSLRLSADERDADCLHAWDVDGGRHVAQFSRQHGAGRFARLLATRGELTCLGRTEAEELARHAGEVAAEMAPAANDVEPAAAPVDYSTDPNFTLC
jgi:hypothetical protein